ncbi:stage III sporulation protein AD [Clostridium frigidicarnis]|uniref:Stage III sporulation protein AD n=1 Tax=Clostridium frigidicarnis TaxID=84698 RepID=A0A1I0WG83_9CLOT|nr:stage III sporulation protein AD [Clostridium frigidicarnis]SFA87795.1 stage III sporulation protein AD [Clostridium frigidicarnis]
MEILKISGFILIALFLVMLFRNAKRDDIGIQISIVVGVIILLFLTPKIMGIITFLNNLSLKANIDTVYLSTVLKIMGIAYIASFCSDICKDAGAGSLASKVELSGKILILVLAIPILMAVLDSILKIL